MVRMNCVKNENNSHTRRNLGPTTLQSKAE